MDILATIRVLLRVSFVKGRTGAGLLCDGPTCHAATVSLNAKGRCLTCWGLQHRPDASVARRQRACSTNCRAAGRRSGGGHALPRWSASSLQPRGIGSLPCLCPGNHPQSALISHKKRKGQATKLSSLRRARPLMSNRPFNCPRCRHRRPSSTQLWDGWSFREGQANTSSATAICTRIMVLMSYLLLLCHFYGSGRPSRTKISHIRSVGSGAPLASRSNARGDISAGA